MEVGQLRHRITVQQRLSVQDASGDPVVTWSTLGELWAKVEPVSGREATYAGEQTLAEMDTRVYIRWSPLGEQITAGHRLEHQGTILNVISPAHILLGKQWIEIRCKSGINDG